MSEELEHIGVERRSGRYPWGSGENPKQRNRDFLGFVDKLEKQGLTEKEIADGYGITIAHLRARRTAATNEKRRDDIAMANRLADKGMSNVAIAKRMGVSEATVRNLRNPKMKERADVLTVTTDMLRAQVDTKKFIDIGAGVENDLNLSQTKLKAAVAVLKDEGYGEWLVKVPQAGNNMTLMKVLAPPGVPYSEVYANRHNIQSVQAYTNDGARSFKLIEPPVQVDPKRVAVRYTEEGGSLKDGVIEVRRGVDDVSLGGKNYAQVRIAVGGTHYLKGMAVYADDLPDGVDIRFNTNKSSTGNKLDAMKPLKMDNDDPTKVDADFPFGSIVRQRTYTDKDGNEKLSALNIVNDEGQWDEWSRTLSSQMLSKQTPSLAKKQLGAAYDSRKAQFDEIDALTNPTVKKKLLASFSDDCDSAAVHLKAAALPGQRTHVILPFPKMREGEVYAPNYENGETVVLIRHPHGGIFEIPTLTVNNRNKEAQTVLGKTPRDAIGIHPKVAERLSGADFDGDTVLVIPDRNGTIRTSKALKGLVGFDPKSEYRGYEGMKVMSDTQAQMGNISNLITDMTIRGANNDEIARAVRHSMVVIDAEKHKLDYRRSATDNKISELKATYQGGARKGASTLISQAKGKEWVPERKARSAAEGGAIDPRTGKLMYTPTNTSRLDANGNRIPNRTQVKKMALTDDAFTLSSGTLIEDVYATHANKLKALANESRRVMVNTPDRRMSQSAKQTYAQEVSSLNAKLNVALKNKPRERQALVIANSMVTAKLQANPHLSKEDIKKLKRMSIATARGRVGAERKVIKIEPLEWDAIQMGAISANKLAAILENADLAEVKKYATPRETLVMQPARVARAKSMLSAGHTQAEVANALGVSITTLTTSIE